MHHLYPLAKGDQLCPLGFHPQVRWPTRCKRCFRDYKEHGGKRGSEDIAASTPALSESASLRLREDRGFEKSSRSWTSTQNLSTANDNSGNGIELRKRPSSWTSTPDLEESEKISVNRDKSTEVSFSINIPQRRHTIVIDPKELEDTVTLRRPPIPPGPKKAVDETVILNTDSLAERVRKMNLKKQSSVEREGSREKSVPRKTEKEKSPAPEPEQKTISKPEIKKKELSPKKSAAVRKQEESNKQSQDIQFLMHVKQNVKHRQDDNISTTSETTDTTLVGPNDRELQEEISELKRELEQMKTRAERAEREKSDILLRRLASMDTGSNRTAASEALKLQQKVNELKSQVEELSDDRKSLSLRVRELEQDLDARPSKNIEEILRQKLQAAEQLCEELMDENEDIKKELRGMESEIDEMHDNFREDQVEEFTTIRKELEQTTKNCRILSFKLKKSDRKIEQLEQEKVNMGSQNNSDLSAKVKRLEEELKLAAESARKLQTEADQAKNTNKKKAPSLGVIGKSTSADGKFSRESLTRGGSQEDPIQLLRDLQDSMEREADLKEQLKFAEEESKRLRHKRRVMPRENKGMQTEIEENNIILSFPRGTQTQVEEKDVGVNVDEELYATIMVSVECNTNPIMLQNSATTCCLDKKDYNDAETQYVRDINQSKDVCVSTDEIQFFDTETQTDILTTKEVATSSEPISQSVASESVQTLLNSTNYEFSSLSTQTERISVSNSSTEIDNDLGEPSTRSVGSITVPDVAPMSEKPSVSASFFTFPKIQGFLFPNIISGALVMASAAGMNKSYGLRFNIESTSSVLKRNRNPSSKNEDPLFSENTDSIVYGSPNVCFVKAESLRKKATRVEDENESLMMQLKKMATKARSRKLSPTPSRLTPEPPVEHDEGISDEDDPAELRVLLELNEQEASVLRQKVEDLEAENTESKKQVRELQEKLKLSSKESSKKLPSLLSKSTNSATEKKLKILEDEVSELRKSIIEKERNTDRLQAEITALKSKTPSKLLTKTNSFEGNDQQKIDLKRQLEVVEQEASILRSKIPKLEEENEKLSLENKKLQVQSLRKNSLTNTDKSAAELTKVKESLSKIEKERDDLSSKLKTIIEEANEKLPPRTAKKVTDLTPKTTLKKMVEDLEDEIKEMRAVVVRSGADKIQKLEADKTTMQKELKETKDQLTTASSDLKKLKAGKDISAIQAGKLSDLEQKLKKSEEEGTKLSGKIKDLEDKIKKQDTQIKQTESTKATLETQMKRDKDKLTALEKDYEKEKKEKDRWETKVADLDIELTTARKTAEKNKTTLEKEIQDLKVKAGTKNETGSTKKLQDLRKQYDDLQDNLTKETKKYSDLNGRYENLQEEYVLIKAQLSTERLNLQAEVTSVKNRIAEIEVLRTEKTEIAKKLNDTQKKISELESKNMKSGAAQYEKNMLKTSLDEKEKELEKLRKENDMNISYGAQMRKDNDELRKKLDDFERVSKVHRTLSDHNNSLENELKKMRLKLDNTELTAKSEIASTRLRYEQQNKNIQAELNSMQRQCERFKKDRDTFKQLLEAAQKTIGDLKQQTNSGRQSRASMNSGDEDDRGKILFLEQQVGCLEDQLCEARLDVSRLKTELVSERSASEIKISEMTSKLNEFEEDRLIGSGRTKIPGMKTKLELSWQKEREDQQRLLQETSTLARDLRQTLFEVERERDKERLESKRKLDQLKRNNEEEIEEGRKKISELQCDLLELRDAHAKLRTSNEKLRRERERNEKELLRRRLDQDGERKVGALLQTVDELVKFAPDLKIVAAPHSATNSLNTKNKPDPVRRSHSPSPAPNSIQISSVLARLAEASEELRRFQRVCEDEKERDKSRKSGMRRATSTENDGQPLGLSRVPSGKISRSSTLNGSLYRKSLSLDQSIQQQDQSIWRQDDGSLSSIQSIDSELGGMVRDSSMDSRLSGGSTQSDIPRGPRKKKRGLMGKLRSLTKSGRNAESEGSIQGSDSDVSVSSDIRSSKKDLKGRLSGMFKRSGPNSRSGSTEHILSDSQQRPVAVTIVGDDDFPKKAPVPITPKPIRSIAKPPTSTTPSTQRKAK